MHNANYNIFVAYLDLLKVRHTKSFSEKFFNEHPYKSNLFGISQMLSEYNIENKSVKIIDKVVDIFNIDCPFIANLGNTMVIVYNITPNRISYIEEGKKKSLSSSEFITIWTGVVLLSEINQESIEPDYKKHRQTEFLNSLQTVVLISSIIILFGIAYFTNFLFSNSIITLLLVINILGMYISYLLMLKHMHIHSNAADQLCSLFKNSDCNYILDSKASKFLGFLGWGEIGLGYFIGNTIILLFSSHLLIYLVIINILTLPYSFWSIIYQKMIIKQWCPLCLIIQVLLWGIFCIDCLFGFNHIIFIHMVELLSVICVYIIPMLVSNILVPLLIQNKHAEHLNQEFRNIKANEAVLKTLLKQEPYYEVKESTSHILFGNAKANLRITILTNPYCQPCAKTHNKVKQLLKETKENVCIQYIFFTHSEEMNRVNKYLIAAYQQKDRKEKSEIFSKWFVSGKITGELFFKYLDLNIETPDVENEFQAHKIWKEKYQLTTTPTILVNGYQLPRYYKIEDLKFMTEFNVNIK